MTSSRSESLVDGSTPENEMNPDAILEENDDGDLFGDDDDNDAEKNIQVGIADTIEEDEDDVEEEEQIVRIYPSDIGRMAEPAHNEDLYVLNVPPFLGLKPENFDPQTYEIPTGPHGIEAAPTDKFSPFSVASTTAFWRYDPEDTQKLQSNTRVVRWSDGSLTLQIASQPRDHYRIATSALRQDFGKTKKPGVVQDYRPEKDSHHFLSAPHAKAEVIRLIQPFGATMKILPSGEQTDEAVLALQKSLAESDAVHDPFASIRNVREDPELAKKRAELAEKDKLKAERKREAMIERESGRKEKVLGRRMGGRGNFGLTIDNLEDEDGMPQAKARKPARRPKRRDDIYSDEEDDGYLRGRTKEDEYDQEDGFLAASDEEPETYDDSANPEDDDDDPDVDDLEIDGRETVLKSKSRVDKAESPKRPAEEAEDRQEETGPTGSPHARKKRRVIDDDDDDE